MAKDAKIGSLIGLVLIFIIAFVINGFTRPRENKGRNESNLVTTDNPSINRIPRADTTNSSIQSISGEAQDPLPPDTDGNTTAHTSLPAPELVTDGSAVVSQSHARTSLLSQVYYVVCEGDNLADIAKKFYGPEEGNKRANIQKIFQANRNVLTSPHEIFVGQKLLIPPLNAQGSSESLFSNSMFETVTSIGRSHLLVPDHAAQQGRLYAVKEGDSLWSISETLLGNGSRYKEISKLNPGILKGEDHLAVGMRLRIPAQ